MTNDMMNVRSLVEKSADADLLREMIGFAAERLMELDVGSATSATERSWLILSVIRSSMFWKTAVDDAVDTELTATMRFASVLRRDIDAVKNAIELPWSNGQAEGQINRLKMLKRAMYGRAGPELMRARMMPLNHRN
jgi:hypothetical protein